MAVLTNLKGHKGPVVSVDNLHNLVASSSEDRTARLWDIRKETSIRRLTDESFLHGGNVGTIRFNPSDSNILFFAYDHHISVFDLRNTDRVLVESCGWVLNAGADESATKCLHDGSCDTEAVLSSPSQPALRDTVNVFGVNKTGTLLAVPFESGSVSVLDATSGDVVVNVASLHDNICDVAAFIPEKNEVITAGYDGAIHHIDAHTGRILNSFDLRPAMDVSSCMLNFPSVTSVAVAPTGNLVAAGCGSGSLVLVSLGGDETTHCRNKTKGMRTPGPVWHDTAHIGEVSCVAWLPVLTTSLLMESKPPKGMKAEKKGRPKKQDDRGCGKCRGDRYFRSWLQTVVVEVFRITSHFFASLRHPREAKSHDS